MSEIRDEYHTLNELYEHRSALFCVLANQNRNLAWKTKWDTEGEILEEGWFVAGINFPGRQFETLKPFPGGCQITYHLAEKYWDHLRCREAARSEWDRNSGPVETYYRLMKIAGEI